MREYTKKDICDISNKLGLSSIPDDWHGIDSIIELIEKIRSDGSVFILKFDGERETDVDNGPYTIIITGQSLGEEYLRIDTDSLENGLAYVIGNYAEIVWGMEK